MGPWEKLAGWQPFGRFAPQNAQQSKSGGVIIDTPEALEAAIRGTDTAAGVVVTADTAMRVAAVFACVRTISGAVANMPLDLKRRIDEKRREAATNHDLWRLLRRKPNRWQTPSQFKRMMQAHQLLRGNAYAMKVTSRGRVLELIPLHPDRVKVKQNYDWSLTFVYTRRDGGQVNLSQNEVLHLAGLTLDGVTGVTPVTYARETIGLALAENQHGANTFKNKARPSHVLIAEKRLGEEGRRNLQQSLEEYRMGGDSEGKALILEEGIKPEKLSLSAQDIQWIESRKFSRTDICMFFGVPPHMIGDTEKSTSWGTGIEQQTIGFTTFTLEDHLTSWEETCDRDLVGDGNPDLYYRFNRATLVRGDFKTRSEGYTKALQWGWMNPDEVRAKEDMNPREDGQGGEYYDPPNTAGGKDPEEKDSSQ